MGFTFIIFFEPANTAAMWFFIGVARLNFSFSSIFLPLSMGRIINEYFLRSKLSFSKVKYTQKSKLVK